MLTCSDDIANQQITTFAYVFPNYHVTALMCSFITFFLVSHIHECITLMLRLLHPLVLVLVKSIASSLTTFCTLFYFPVSGLCLHGNPVRPGECGSQCPVAPLSHPPVTPPTATSLGDRSRPHPTPPGITT